MSQTETHFGKLMKIESNFGKSTEYKETPEEFAERYCKIHDIIKEDYYKNYIECLINETRYEFLYCNNSLYRFIEHVEVNDEEVNHLSKNEDGTINFLSQFYNGGTCLEEMLEEGLEKLENE